MTWIAADLPTGSEYPQDLRLEFEFGAVVVTSAFESPDGDLNLGMMDSVTVFFDETTASRMVYGKDGEP